MSGISLVDVHAAHAGGAPDSPLWDYQVVFPLLIADHFVPDLHPSQAATSAPDGPLPSPASSVRVPASGTRQTAPDKQALLASRGGVAPMRGDDTR